MILSVFWEYARCSVGKNGYWMQRDVILISSECLLVRIVIDIFISHFSQIPNRNDMV